MEEDEYKSTYHSLAENRCVFEKALTGQHCQCSHARHFWLADREGYACAEQTASAKCSELLQKLREKSRFSLKLNSIGNQLPHNMELRVQAGGLTGLQSVLQPASSSAVTDVAALVATALSRYGAVAALPYSEIVQHVSRFQGRKKRKRDRQPRSE